RGLRALHAHDQHAGRLGELRKAEDVSGNRSRSTAPRDPSGTHGAREQTGWPDQTSEHQGPLLFDTRLVSFGPSAPTAGPWDLLSSETTTSSTARICLANCSLVTEEGPIAAHTIGLVVDRQIGGGCANISR